MVETVENLEGRARLASVAALVCVLSACFTSPECDDLHFCDECKACAFDPAVSSGGSDSGGGSGAGGSDTESDRGACADAYASCAPDELGSPCDELARCIDACDANQNGVVSSGAELDCVCANDGEDCTAQSLEGSCHDVHSEALALQSTLLACIDSTCKQSCI